MKRFAVLLVFLSTLPAPATAADTPVPGAMVRIIPRNAGSAIVSGKLVEVTPERLQLLTADHALTLVPAEVLLAEERRAGPGRSSIGGAVGFGLGMLVTYLAFGEEAGSSDMFPGLGAAVIVTGGAGGAVLGAIVGSQVREERWQPMLGWDARPAADTEPRTFESLRPGTPIRVTPNGAGRPTTVATVVRTEPDAVHARLENTHAVTFSAAEILLIEERATLRERGGAMLGGLAGIAAGIVFARAKEERPITEALQVFAATGAGAITGGMLGRASSRRWEVVHGWDRRVADAAPVPRVGVQLAWRW